MTAERDPVAECLAPLLAQPVGGLAHETTLATGRLGTSPKRRRDSPDAAGAGDTNVGFHEDEVDLDPGLRHFVDPRHRVRGGPQSVDAWEVRNVRGVLPPRRGRAVRCGPGPGSAIGRPPVLALGITPGFGVAVASGILLGEDCSDEVFCFGPTPGEAFVLGLIASLVLYPGWAFGAGLGALTRSGRRHGEESNR